MIRRWTARALEILVAWIEWHITRPVMERIEAQIAHEAAVTRAAQATDTARLAGKLAALSCEVRTLNDALVSAAQLREFGARLDRVDERLAHLAALMFGKNIAEVVDVSRGPRIFTHEDRQ